MSRKWRNPVDEHLEWLGGRWPSEVRRERERDLSDYPLARFAESRKRRKPKRGKERPA